MTHVRRHQQYREATKAGLCKHPWPLSKCQSTYKHSGYHQMIIVPPLAGGSSPPCYNSENNRQCRKRTADDRGYNDFVTPVPFWAATRHLRVLGRCCVSTVRQENPRSEDHLLKASLIVQFSEMQISMASTSFVFVQIHVALVTEQVDSGISSAMHLNLRNINLASRK